MTDNVLNGPFEAGKDGSGLDTTVFHALLESDLPPEEKSSWRLWQEGQTIIGAGSETTANTLSVIHFHLLDNPDALSKLRAELQEALPTKYTPMELRYSKNYHT